MANLPTFGDGRLLHPEKRWTALYRYKFTCLHTQVYNLNVICHFSTIIFQPCQSLASPSSTLGGGDRHMRSRIFLYKIQFRTTFI